MMKFEKCFLDFTEKSFLILRFANEDYRYQNESTKSPGQKWSGLIFRTGYLAWDILP